MDRRNLVKSWSAFAVAAALPRPATSARTAGTATQASVAVSPLVAPNDRPLAVAFVLAQGAEVVDFAGPWGVFEYTDVPDRDGPAFELFTVAESVAPLKVSGGLTVMPDHTFENAPVPRIIVVPALGGDPSPAMLGWLRKTAAGTDLTMSVCNGAFALAKAGLLTGRNATAHHGSVALLAADFPDIHVKRGARFADAGGVSTAGGLTSGIDLALHVVERYFGREAVERTVNHLEYQGQGWKDPNSNVAYANKPISTDAHPICPICEMEVDKGTTLSEHYHGHVVYFCSEEHKARFDQTPERFVIP